MAARADGVASSSLKLCNIFVLICFIFSPLLLKHILAMEARITYNVNTLINVRKGSTGIGLSTADLQTIISRNIIWSPKQISRTKRQCKRCDCPRKRGKGARKEAILLPSLLLTNVCPQENKKDQIRHRLTQQREIRDCCAHIFTETWLHKNILDQAFALSGWTVFHADRT